MYGKKHKMGKHSKMMKAKNPEVTATKEEKTEKAMKLGIERGMKNFRR